MTEPRKPESEGPETDDAADRPDETGTEEARDSGAEKPRLWEEVEETPQTAEARDEAQPDDTQPGDASPEDGARETEGESPEPREVEPLEPGMSAEPGPDAERGDAEVPDDPALAEGPFTPDEADADGTRAEGETVEPDIAEAALRDAETTHAHDAGAEGETARIPDDAVRGPEAEPERPAPPPPSEQVVVEKRGGFLPGFLGGVIAVAGGLFAAPYVLPENMRPITSLAPVEAQLSGQADEIAAVSGRVDEIAASAATAEEVGAVQDSLAALDEQTAARLDTLSTRLDEIGGRIEDFEARLAEAEKRPLADSADPEVVAALEAYGREVEQLRGEVEAQTEENARLIEEAAVASRAAQEAAMAEAQAAEERARMAELQQALVDVQAALEAGDPFAEALSGLSALEVPAALTQVAGEGVATLAQLQADFAAPAREALDAARRATMPDDPADRGLSFLQTQLGIRSLAPRDGDSPDAILSRAEAAARSGDLTEAVAELEALPDPARAEMSDWMERATTRAEAVAAADDLARQLATN